MPSSPDVAEPRPELAKARQAVIGGERRGDDGMAAGAERWSPGESGIRSIQPRMKYSYAGAGLSAHLSRTWLRRAERRRRCMILTWTCQSCKRTGSIRTEEEPAALMVLVRKAHHIEASGCAGGTLSVMNQSAEAVKDRERVAPPKVAPAPLKQ